MLEISSSLDFAIWAFLFVAFYYSFPKGYVFRCVVTVAFLIKGVHSYFTNLEAFQLSSHTLTIFALLSALYHARFSPNYRWLLLGLLTIKIIDVSINEWLLQQKSFFYIVIMIMDFLIILLISHRAQMAKWLEKQNIFLVSRLSKDCMGQFGFSTQEMGLVAIYWAYIAISFVTLCEDLIFYYTSFSPSFFYKLYAPLKLPLNLVEMLLIFSIACGYARGVYSGRRIM